MATTTDYIEAHNESIDSVSEGDDIRVIAGDHAYAGKVGRIARINERTGHITFVEEGHKYGPGVTIKPKFVSTDLSTKVD